MKTISDLIVRRFTSELENNPDKTVYDLFEWKIVDVLIKDHARNKVVCDMKGLEFPVHYSQNACDIIAAHYFRKAGVPNEVGHERSMREVAHRMVEFWTSSLLDEGLLDDEEQKQILYDELVYLLLSQAWAPNSPQWFNTGLNLAYGIAGSPDGHYYYDLNKKEVVESSDRYTRTQASACFILSIQDKLMGDQSISEQYITETKLFKGGSGTGTNFSTLRAEGERLSGGGYSSGLLSFLKGFDKNAGAIKSGGTTRRAAKMVIVDDDHPDIMQFVTWKAKEEDKVRALGKMGYDMDFNGEAYSTVSGQNSNNSIRLSDDTMSKVLNLDEKPDAAIALKGRVDSAVDKELPVKELWEAINQSAYSCADPGLQFHGRFNEWHTCPAGEDGQVWAKHNQINATNPCSEYAFLNDTACNLASINLYQFYQPESREFLVEDFIHTIGLIQMVLEASIHWGQFPTKQIALRSHLFRTTGLGPANLSSVLMAAGLPYDSDEARTLAAAIQGIMTGYSYYVSSLMAQKLSPFEKYSLNAEHMLRVIRNHSRVAGAREDEYEGLSYQPIKVNHERLREMGFAAISDSLRQAWNLAYESGSHFGYRNAQVTVVAPTGTISFAMDCGATSIEPFYAHVIYKKLVSGSAMTMVNPVIETALKNLNYSEEEVDAIVSYILRRDDKGHIIDGKIEGAPYLKPEHYPIFDTASKCGTGTRFISPEGHVLMVSAITPMISGSISKTVNLPNSATVKDIENIHLLAYTTGTKAIAIYRDGSKASQPLTSGIASDSERKLEDMSYQELLEIARSSRSKVPVRVKARGRRAGFTHSAKIGDIELYVTVNFYPNGKIAELFISTDKEGTVVKGLLASLSKAISNMLQYNIPPQEISRTLRGQQYEPSGFVSRHPYIKQATSISDLVSKIIDIELGDFSRCQVKPNGEAEPVLSAKDLVTAAYYEPVESVKAAKSALEPTPGSQPEEEEGERIYGETCSNCGSTRLRKNGTCKVCEECGATTGCS
ncbi:MAG: vitamin B12-dependent ribonucleotide reductase [Caldicoprobacterales bacterium]|jgi:ribonucleoside-diphosphate reductase alpha chain|nr:vitamin B12-dependent ribonucleotide reductase [Clostridiales bacterium]